jgi:hypothetical protein
MRLARQGEIDLKVIKEGVTTMNGEEHFLGMVQNGEFLALTTPFSGGHKVMLTKASMQAAEAPEGEKLDLSEYEDSAIMGVVA